MTDIDLGDPYRLAFSTLDDLLSTYDQGVGRNIPDISQFPFHHIMRLWIQLSKHSSCEFFHHFCCKLERLIISTLTEGDAVAAFVLITAIRKCCLSETITVAFDYQKYDLIKLFLNHDVTCFGHFVAKELVIEGRVNDIDRSWLAAILLCEAEKQGQVKTKIIDYFPSLVRSISDALCHALTTSRVSLFLYFRPLYPKQHDSMVKPRLCPS
jgi:hypothetical protein